MYSFSIYLNDSQPRLWGAWGDYLAEAFTSVCGRTAEAFQKRSLEAAESALIALMQAARHPNSEPKARKYIAKIFCLLSYDNEKRQLLATFDSYASLVPAANWLNWIPQIITLLIRNDETGKYVANLMFQIVRMHPLAVYYSLRTLYLKLKNDDQTEKIKFQLQQQILIQQQQQNGVDSEMRDASSTPKLQPPQSESLIRVTTLMHRQREMHPTLFSTLESLIDQLLLLKVNWYEESLRNFKQTRNAAYSLAFDSLKSPSASVHELTIDPFSISWFKRLQKFFAMQTPNVPPAASNNSQLASIHNQRMRSILAFINDPNYQIAKQRFQTDFNFSLPSASINVFAFIAKIKSWIKLFEAHLKNAPQTQLLDDRFKFVTQFCSNTADIEIPGEFLIPRHTNYYVKISRFLPKFESVEKYNAYARRISLRGHNGKTYPFLILSEVNYYECRREEHCMQVIKLFLTYVLKDFLK